MGRYAQQTTVPVERSRAEIEETLRRYGASEFHSGWTEASHMIAFRIAQLFVRFILPLPKRDEKRFLYKMDRRSNRHVKRTDQQAYKEWEQEIRQRWRALNLVVKAKLEAVECGVSSIEQEFLAFVVMPNDLTIGEWLTNEALPAIRADRMPALGYKAVDIQDAEFE